MSWRDHATPIIRRVLESTKGKPEKEIRAALRDAYPYGVRRHWPYKIWLDEIKRQRGKKPPLWAPEISADQMLLPNVEPKEDEDGERAEDRDA